MTSLDDYNSGDNPYMSAKSLADLREMEAQLYRDTWEDGKLKPGMEDYYTHQMELFDEAFATLFPDEYNFHRKIRKP
jgi:hypothetical protein